ncbi:hypothetical protein DHEL01_v203074 [Diaporthe helianthi]|uniref:C2H2-type domain-containing protein n=1 Tax=Diaporthe helianthi TaxID=158607 RepID=A0A2P5I7S0_DIAHE|nr:hypothetical protein DHEL01_v203074 [Diaporthe helianthi]
MTVINGKCDDSNILVLVASGYPHNRSPWVYVAYNFIYSQRLIPAYGLQNEVSQGFGKLRQEILACNSGYDADEGLVGFYIVIIANRSGPQPAELQEGDKAPICFGICEETFDLWTDRQWHRVKVHELDKDIDALPGNTSVPYI